jgi:hypothetical protein
MKADVHPRPAADELEIPDWMPERLAQHIRIEYAKQVHFVYKRAIYPEHGENAEYLADQADVRVAHANVVHEDLIKLNDRYRRVVRDPRMRRVWQQLFTRRKGASQRPARLRRKGAFQYPARLHGVCRWPPRLPAADANERQEEAVLEIFNQALNNCHNLLPVDLLTQAEAELWRRDYLDKAEELERDVIVIKGRYGGFGQPILYSDRNDLDEPTAAVLAHDERPGQTLRHAAEVYRWLASQMSKAKPGMPERKTDPSGRELALRLAHTFRALFGDEMCGLTATIASVVLDRQIKRGTVVNWLKTPA